MEHFAKVTLVTAEDAFKTPTTKDLSDVALLGVDFDLALSPDLCIKDLSTSQHARYMINSL